MEESAIVEFQNHEAGVSMELEIPLNITANDLILALNEACKLGLDTDNLYSCFLIAENPIAFLRGNKSLEEFGIRNGTKIIFKRGE